MSPLYKICLGISLVIMILAGIIVMVVLFSLPYFNDNVTLAVTNKTDYPLDNVMLKDGRNKIILDLGTIPPGGTATKFAHFKAHNCEGPAFLFATQPDRPISGNLAILLDDNGPFEFNVDITPTVVHVNRLVGSIGSGEYDVDPLTPDIIDMLNKKIAK